MKKSLVALAVLGAIAGAASAQTSNVTIYGIADAGIAYKSGAASATRWSVGSGQQSGSRLGFRGTEDLGGGLSAIFTLENGYNIDDGTQGQSALFGRQAWVGLNSTSFGAVKLGRQYLPVRQVLETVNPFGLGLAGHIGTVFNLYNERANNSLTYTSPSFYGLTVNALYALGEVAGNNGTGHQAGGSVVYNNGPIYAALAYNYQNNASTTTPVVSTGNNKGTVLALAYDFGVVKLHGAYEFDKGENAAGVKTRDQKNSMIGVSAPVSANGTVLASWIHRNDKLIDNGDVNQWSLGYTYALSKRTNLYTSYARVNNQSAATAGNASNYFGSAIPAGNDPSLFNVGVRHQF
jgi:predicted porin